MQLRCYWYYTIEGHIWNPKSPGQGDPKSTLQEKNCVLTPDILGFVLNKNYIVKIENGLKPSVNTETKMMPKLLKKQNKHKDHYYRWQIRRLTEDCQCRSSTEYIKENRKLFKVATQTISLE